MFQTNQIEGLIDEQVEAMDNPLNGEREQTVLEIHRRLELAAAADAAWLERGNRSMKRLHRLWCRVFHRSVRHVAFAGGPTWQCRTCGERWENPALDGPVKPPATGLLESRTVAPWIRSARG